MNYKDICHDYWHVKGTIHHNNIFLEKRVPIQGFHPNPVDLCGTVNGFQAVP